MRLTLTRERRAVSSIRKFKISEKYTGLCAQVLGHVALLMSLGLSVGRYSIGVDLSRHVPRKNIEFEV